jgi:hypothetical protein
MWKAQVDLAQVAAFLLVVAASRQGGAVGGVDVAEEIGAVINQGAQIDLKVLHEAVGQGLFDRLDVGFLDPIHVIPEGLAGEQVGGGRKQAGEDGLLVPMGQLGLAGGTGGPIETGQEQVLADGQALIPLGKPGVDQVDQVQLEGLIVEGGEVAEGQDLGGCGRGRCVRGLDS